MLLLLACLQTLPQGKVPVPPKPPNILIIVADDVGTDLVGCYAKEYADLSIEPCTPRIDALAAEGMRFTNVWSNPICSPSRTQILTGKPSRATGVGTITWSAFLSPTNVGLQPDQPTLATVLEDYATAAVGKWHVSDPTQDLGGLQNPIQLGFDSYAGTMYGMKQYDDWTKTYSPPGAAIDNYNVYTTTDTADDALELISTLEEPWLLHVGFFSTHWPLHCPGESGFDLADCKDDPSCSHDWCGDCTNLVSDPLCQSLGVDVCYARAMTHALDSKVGELLDAIDSSNTAVIFTSDNGTVKRGIAPPFDSKHSKGTLYQGGIQVPLIVRAPGSAAGVNHDLVSLTDIFATVTDLAGVTPPPSPGRDSNTLLPLLYPDPSVPVAKRRFVYSEWFDSNFVPEGLSGPPAGYVGRFHHRALRNETHKVIDRHGWDAKLGKCSSTIELYRLADSPGQNPALGPDPFEQNDLFKTSGPMALATEKALHELLDELDSMYPRLSTVCP